MTGSLGMVGIEVAKKRIHCQTRQGRPGHRFKISSAQWHIPYVEMTLSDNAAEPLGQLDSCHGQEFHATDDGLG